FVVISFSRSVTGYSYKFFGHGLEKSEIRGQTSEVRGHPTDRNDTVVRAGRSEISRVAEMIGWHAKCEVHEKFTVDDIRNVRKQFPDVVILAHPECSPEVVVASDFSGSTSAMIRYVEQTHAPRYLLLTECAMGDNIAAANPEKEMLRLCSVRCPHMNQITLEDTLAALRMNRYEITVEEEIAKKARRALERMLQVAPGRVVVD
ncbi:MAG: quinolinate synthase NadA, partial [Ignavibacteriales bacterium]|nr:quinolinate synthase NadA [Ignavibacteriales bacterium]